MKTVSVFEAAKQFSDLLIEVNEGKTVAINKHGINVAYLVPARSVAPEKEIITQTMSALRRLRSNTTLGKNISIAQLKNAGRS